MCLSEGCLDEMKVGIAEASDKEHVLGKGMLDDIAGLRTEVSHCAKLDFQFPQAKSVLELRTPQHHLKDFTKHPQHR